MRTGPPLRCVALPCPTRAGQQLFGLHERTLRDGHDHLQPGHTWPPHVATTHLQPGHTWPPHLATTHLAPTPWPPHLAADDGRGPVENWPPPYGAWLCPAPRGPASSCVGCLSGCCGMALTTFNLATPGHHTWPPHTFKLATPGDHTWPPHTWPPHLGHHTWPLTMVGGPLRTAPPPAVHGSALSHTGQPAAVWAVATH